MKTIFNGILKFMSVICSLLFIVAVVLVMIVVNSERQLLQERLYFDALNNMDVYERFPTLAHELILSWISETKSNNEFIEIKTYLGKIPSQDLYVLIETTFPEDLLDEFTRKVVKSSLEYIKGNRDTIDIPLVEIREQIIDSSGVDAIVELLQSKPPCSIDQISQITHNNVYEKRHDLVFCNPSDKILELSRPLYQSEINVFERIPVSIIITPPDNITDIVRTIQKSWLYIVIFPVSLLLLITIFAVRTLRGWMGWWGGLFLVSGIVGLILTFYMNALFTWIFSNYLNSWFLQNLTESLVKICRDIISAMVSSLAKPMAIQSSVLFVIGLISVICATQIGKHRS